MLQSLRFLQKSQLISQAEAEADTVDEAGLLVQAAQVTDEFDDGVLFLGGCRTGTTKVLDLTNFESCV